MALPPGNLSTEFCLRQAAATSPRSPPAHVCVAQQPQPQGAYALLLPARAPPDCVADTVTAARLWVLRGLETAATQLRR